MRCQDGAGSQGGDGAIRTGGMREPGPDGAARPLDLSTLQTSDTDTQPERAEGAQGYLVNPHTRQAVALAEPWRIRARRCYRVSQAWARAVMQEVAAGKGHVVRVGATLRPGVSWQPRMGSQFIQRCRREFGSHLLGSLTVLEMQKRGAAHYNFVLWLEHGQYLPKPDKAGWWPHGSTNVQACRTVTDIMYAARYVGKDGQKGGPGGPPLPKGAHLYAATLRNTKLGRLLLGLARLPQWLRDQVTMAVWETGQLPKRCSDLRRRGYLSLTGGWWHHGKQYTSPWEWWPRPPCLAAVAVSS